MKKDYETYNHAKHCIRYHIILSVKYHRRILRNIINDIKESFKAASENSGKWHIEEMETDLKHGKDHHVHLMIKARPSVAPYEIVSDLKRYSTVNAWLHHNDFLKKIFWNGKHHIWTRGYFCATIGDASKETIEQYIKEQG